MTPITVLIAEDEQPQRQALQQMLQELMPEANIQAVCEDGLSALEAMQQYQPNLALLDIRMPGLSGIEVARSAPANTQIIFTTAYDEYAVKAFEAGAIDYLLKPIKPERLQQALERVRERLQNKAAPDISDLIDALETKLRGAANKSIKWVTANVGDTVKMFSIDDVLFFQAQDKYIRVVTNSDEAIIRTPLKELINSLDPDIFWQVHRSVVVRVSAIDRVHKDELGHYLLTLKDRSEILPISSAFQSRFRGM
ncbi:MAG: LytR/AlgR family response regulator transcription factor [Arenimonas sp.]